MKSSNTIGTNNGKPNAQRGVPYLPDYITPYWLSLIAVVVILVDLDVFYSRQIMSSIQ
jgi:hypothetical protein